jgi:DNA-binding HxlR family transcriptional regulator
MAVLGEAWTLLILRDIFLGANRFDDLQRDLGVPRKVLSERLTLLVEKGVLMRAAYQDGRTRYQYELTEKGRSCAVILVSFMNWGDRWTAGVSGPPLLVRHSNCGGQLHTRMTCSKCLQAVSDDDLFGEAGPGARGIRGTATVGRHLHKMKTLHKTQPKGPKVSDRKPKRARQLFQQPNLNTR